jgi:hypothetical protein
VRVSAGSALNYATMPGIFPRLKDILFSGFGPVTQLIGIICFMAGLLPKNHPCFVKETRDQYGLTRILAAAASGIEFKWKNIDKIVVFGLIVCGTVMLWLYIAGTVMFLLSSPSFASSISTVLQTASPTNDVAFMMLDRVMGIPGLFNSSVSMSGNFPNPFQIALHQLFNFYSMAIFFVALIIFLYHVIHLVLQITQTGKVTENMSDEDGEGGRNFSWLPIRFVMAFGLLIPFGMGLNSGQWITLYVAKMGSSLATNAWIGYNTATGDNPIGDENKHLIAKPPTQDNSGLIKALFLLNSCRRITLLTQFNPEADQAYPYIVNGSKNKSLFNYPGEPGFMDKPTTANPSTYNATLPTIAAGNMSDQFIQILDFSDYHDIKLVIGTFDPAKPEQYQEYPGKVLPTCGEITIPVTNMTGEGVFAAEGYFFAVIQTLFEVYRPGAVVSTSDPIEDMWLALMREYLRTSGSVKNAKTLMGMSDADFQTSYGGDIPLMGPITGPVYASYWNLMMDDYFRYAFRVPAFTAYDFLADSDEAYSDPTIDPKKLYVHNTPAAFSAVGKQNPLLMTVGILDYGWGGAGLWYNKIGERNGSLYSATAAVPIINKFPMVMEQIKEQRAKTDTKTDGGYCEKFNPRKSGTSSISLQNEKNQFEIEQATALYAFCVELFENQALNQDGVTRVTSSTNPVEKAIHMFFSEFQIFDSAQNKEVSPMAQLSSVGRILIDKAILGVTASALSYATGGAAYMAAGDNKQAEAFAAGAGAIGDATMTIALIGLSSGFVLYYMLPMLPFVYFFFAVGRWVKVIFEALVGVPLWALAHMRVGGPGLPGSAAMNGYFLLLEIFIRPILTVFGLVASFAIFSALAVGLNTIFTLVSANLFGSVAPSLSSALGAAEKLSYVELSRGMIDQFFLTIFYIMLIYSIGIGSFKLIDLIPDNIMRWSGSGAQSIAPQDSSDDLIEEWQWQLPQRFNAATASIGREAKDILYEPGHTFNAQQKAAAKKAAEANAKQAEAAKGAGGQATKE